MRNSKVLILGLATLCIGAVFAFVYMKLTSVRLWSTNQGEVRSASSNEIMVMRTPGGLLEVSRIHATEICDTKFVYEVLGFEIGETVPRIRVPAVYRYQIELAPEWKVVRAGGG